MMEMIKSNGRRRKEDDQIAPLKHEHHVTGGPRHDLSQPSRLPISFEVTANVSLTGIQEQ